MGSLARSCAVAAMLLAVSGGSGRVQAMSCHDYVRASVLQDPDGMDTAKHILAPLAGAGSTSDFSFLYWETLTRQECQLLPDDTLDDIVATHLRAIARQEEQAARRQVAHEDSPNGTPSTPPAPDSSGGSPDGTLTDKLSNVQRGAIDSKVRECWTKAAGALDLEKMQVFLLVTVDGEGIVRKVNVAPEDAGKMSDPRFRKFAERAVKAVLDPRCAGLPVPRSLISGGSGTLKFRFRLND